MPRFVRLLLRLLPAACALPAAFATDVLFVGNSFTYGFNNYNASAIADANGTGMGGVPALFKKLAVEGGFADVNVTIEAIGGQTLAYHHANKSGLIAKPWDYVVLQEYSTGPLTTLPSGNVAAFRQSVQNLDALVKAHNPAVRVVLYETWARPDMVPTANYPTLRAMQDELRVAYSDAVRDFSFHDWAPVGDAFLRAVDDGVARDPAGLPAGQITLWASDHYHANAYGAYLSALVFYAKILGGDPRALPTGAGSAVAGLGLDAARADQLQEIAHLTITDSAPPPALSITSQPVSRVVFAGDAVRFAAGAEGDALSFQWLHNGAPLAGATSATLDIADVQAARAGLYQLRVTDGGGMTALSNPVTLTLATGLLTRRWLVDFGSSQSGYRTLNPSVGGLYWNNLTNAAAGATLSSLTLADNSVHPSASLSVTTAFSGVNSNGPNTTAGDHPARARRDSFFVTGTGTVAGPRKGALLFAGLDPAARYAVTLFASRDDVSSRVTRFTLGDVAPVHLEAADNSGQTALVADARPRADGTLALSVEPYDAAGALQEYGYLNFIDVTESRPAASHYAVWTSRNALPAQNAAPAADPDRDGVANLLEFALGRDPARAESAGALAATLDDTGRLVLDVSRNPDAAELSFVVEVSSDLITWVSGPAHTTTEIDTAEQLRVRDNVVAGSASRRFLRLRVTTP